MKMDETSDPPTIQIHYIPMHEQSSSRSLIDPTTEAGKAWKKFIELLESAEGVQKVWWAFQDDNEDNVGVFAGESCSLYVCDVCCDVEKDFGGCDCGYKT